MAAPCRSSHKDEEARKEGANGEDECYLGSQRERERAVEGGAVRERMDKIMERERTR
jgi:hypothetical protein